MTEGWRRTSAALRAVRPYALRIAASAVAPAFVVLAYGMVFAWTLRQHACEYDPFAEWSEIALFHALLGGALAAVVAGIGRWRVLFYAAIAVPIAAALVFGLATWRHAGIEQACERRTLPQASAYCGLGPSQVTSRRMQFQTKLTVRGSETARLCLAAWANWQDELRVEGEDFS